MTYQDFLARLKQTRRGWELGPEGQIRQFGFGLVACPISASYSPPTLWNCAHTLALAEEMGLDEETRNAISRAADNLPYADQIIRHDLLVACGLSVEHVV